MSRVAGVEDKEAGLRTKFIYWLIRRRLGHVPHGARVRALDPKLLEVAGRMDLYVSSAGSVPLNLKELAQLKVAAMVGCPF